MRGDFVIQLRPEVDLERGIVSGRVEHIDSGQSTRFRNIQELLAFLAQRMGPQDENPASARPSTAFPAASKDLTKP